MLIVWMLSASPINGFIDNNDSKTKLQTKTLLRRIICLTNVKQINTGIYENMNGYMIISHISLETNFRIV